MDYLVLGRAFVETLVCGVHFLPLFFLPLLLPRVPLSLLAVSDRENVLACLPSITFLLAGFLVGPFVKPRIFVVSCGIFRGAVGAS